MRKAPDESRCRYAQPRRCPVSENATYQELATTCWSGPWGEHGKRLRGLHSALPTTRLNFPRMSTIEQTPLALGDYHP